MLLEKLKGRFEMLVNCFKSFERQARDAGVVMGENNYVTTRFWGSEPYLVTIGSNVCITNGVRIFTHGGQRVARKFYPDFDHFGKVKIGDWVYLGTNALIMPGVTIGDNVLVAAGSVVTKSVESGMVVAGNPAKVLCTVEEYIERNMKYNLNCANLSFKEKREFLLSLPDDRFMVK